MTSWKAPASSSPASAGLAVPDRPGLYGGKNLDPKGGGPIVARATGT